MLHINDTTESIKIRTGTLKNYVWKTVKPGEEIDIPWFIAEGTALTKVKDAEEKVEEDAEEKVVEDPIKDDAVFREELKIEDLANYRKELIAIKGVGKKSAEDIIEEYPTKDLLVAAIYRNEEIHNYDNVDRAVKQAFERN